MYINTSEGIFSSKNSGKCGHRISVERESCEPSRHLKIEFTTTTRLLRCSFQSFLSILIKYFPLLWVTENFIGLCDVFKLILSFRALIFVWMKFQSHFPVGFSDLVFAGVAWNIQNVVIILSHIVLLALTELVGFSCSWFRLH